MLIKLFPLLLTLLSLACFNPEARLVEPGRSVVLPPSAVEAVLDLCSRAGPVDIEGTWLVPASVVEQLEADLYKVSRMRSDECCLLGARVRKPGEFYRQYVGIVIEGRELVYVNAFAWPEPGWEERAVKICDGDWDLWGVLYDPETRRFSQLAFNGSA